MFGLTHRAVQIQTSLPIAQPSLNPVVWLRLLCLVGGLLAACHFYGVGLNLLFILPVLLCVTVVFVSIPAERFAQQIRQAPLFTFGCLATLIALAVQHTIFSISVDTSFAPTLIAASLPLWALATALFCSDVKRRVWLMQGVCTVVFVFATVSAGDFILNQQRAHAPLWDPNNYVTLLYLAWLPWLFHRLGQPLTGVGALTNVAVCFVVCLAMLATHSRVAMMVVAGVVVGLIIARWWYRLAGSTVASLCLGALMAALVYLGIDLSGAASAFSAPTNGAGSSEGQRLMMISATLDALKNFGGWAGTGLYTFTLLYPIYRSPLEQNTTASFVHNDYLQLLLETGVWGLTPFLLLLIAIVVAGLRRVVMTRQLDTNAGALVAIGLAMVHAAVNFVVYVLPLTVMLGILLGIAFAPGKETRPLLEQVRTSLAAAVKWLLVAILGINSAFVWVDALSYGVFSAQLHVPGAAYIRRDANSMLDYARLAQTLNPSRGVPVLAEAQLLRRSLQVAPTELAQHQTQGAYQRAIAVDPWNPAAYIYYAEFLRAFPAMAEQDTQAQQLQLLSQALALNPSNAAANQALLEHYVRYASAAGVIQVLRNGLQWCETMRRSQAVQADKLFAQFATVAERIGEQTIIDNVAACTARNYSAVSNGRKPTWLMRWLKDQR